MSFWFFFFINKYCMPVNGEIHCNPFVESCYNSFGRMKTRQKRATVICANSGEVINLT